MSIKAYRLWRYDGAHLRSWGMMDCYWEKPVLKAHCYTKNQHRKSPPVKSCSCGIYAFKKLNEAIINYLLGTHDCIIGEVNLWGKIIEHADGYRAEYAQVEQILLPKLWGKCFVGSRINEGDNEHIIIDCEIEEKVGKKIADKYDCYYEFLELSDYIDLPFRLSGPGLIELIRFLAPQNLVYPVSPLFNIFLSPYLDEYSVDLRFYFHKPGMVSIDANLNYYNYTEIIPPITPQLMLIIYSTMRDMGLIKYNSQTDYVLEEASMRLNHAAYFFAISYFTEL